MEKKKAKAKRKQYLTKRDVERMHRVFFAKEINNMIFDFGHTYDRSQDEHGHILVEFMAKVNNVFKFAMGKVVQELRYGKSVKYYSADEINKGGVFFKGTSDSVTRREPCEICGESRAHNWAHIIPRIEGGPDVMGNFLHLCPTHHHLFDNGGLSKEEWEKLDFSKKSKVAKEYAQRFILPRMKYNWKPSKKSNSDK